MNFRFVLAFCAGLFLAGTLMAQDAEKQETKAHAASANKKKIGFRLTNWKTIHSQSDAAANRDFQALKKIGCEVSTLDHGDHKDVKYRCAKWKTMEVPTEQLVNEWTTWMADKGIETVVVNPDGKDAKFTVKFRLPQAKTFHLHDPNKATDIIHTMRMVGVSVTTNKHGDHLDATLECNEWQTIALANCDKAHGWQDWLEKHGFETQHSH